MPLGIIVDSNKNINSADTWALVTGSTVVSMIVCSVKNIGFFAPSYDYSVDVTNGGQSCGVGYTYNPGGDTFTAPPPPPINWIDTVHQDFDSIVQNLSQTLFDTGTHGGALSNQDIQTSFNSMLSDMQSTFTPNELALMNSILTYIISGG